MTSPRGIGPLTLLRRLFAARRGDVRAMADVYHLRGVITFVAIFAVTIGAPGVMLAYYGVVGLRAGTLASDAEIQRRASSLAAEVKRSIQQQFQRTEESVYNRVKTGQSVSTGLGELSSALRVVYRFDEGGQLSPPLAREERAVGDDQELFFFSTLNAAQRAERLGDPARAAAQYLAAAREAQHPRSRATALFHRARTLQRAGDVAKAELIYRDLLETAPRLREPEGFRLGDLARLKLGEIALQRNPAEGTALLRELVDGLLAETWTIGRPGEAAVVQQAIDLVAGTPGHDADWIQRARGRADERTQQLYWAERLLDELDSLGARGRLLRNEPGKFSYFRTDSAVWAMTWTEAEQYALALELATVVRQAEVIAASLTGTDPVLVATLVPPDGTAPESTLERASLAPWLQGWSVAVHPADPEALRAQREEEQRRGIGIIGLSVVMIVVGALLSASLVQRELDAARDKSDFAAHVSHELRSPITQIRLKAEALQLGLATDEASRLRHYDVIVREAERLSRLVDNVLDFAAIERGRKKYTFRLGDLGATVRRAVEAARVSMEMRDMTLELALPDDLPVVWHDPDAVSQVLTNLLSNAAKYGQEARWVGVTVRATDEEVQVDVADRGIGIDPAEQQAIFEQYYRSSDPQARRRKGTGIGLTIVKYIMEAHGGWVGVASTPGKGSIFTLHFPLKTPAGTVERVGA